VQNGINVQKVLASSVSLEFLEKEKDAYFIIGNFQSLGDKEKVYMCKNTQYSIIEYDYKFCVFRSIEKHKEFTKNECDCVETKKLKSNIALYAYAQKTWFMSEKQRQIFFNNLPFLIKKDTEVLSSVFSDGDIRFIESIKDNEKEEKYTILGSQSWIKGTEQTVEYAKQNDLQYEVVSGLPYHEMLIKMSTNKGLLFLPLGGDTCPRFVIEAKMLGCELILNDHVQHKDEKWFETEEQCIKYVKDRTSYFWSQYE
jgi:hypothetical protein